MMEVSVFRLNMLRCMYLLIVVGLGAVVWPGVFTSSQDWGLNQGVINCMLVSFSLLCALGLRYPLEMIPVLLWELIWKTSWTIIVATPKLLAGTMDESTAEILAQVMVGILIPVVIPWGYVMQRYIKRQGSAWTSNSASGYNTVKAPESK